MIFWPRIANDQRVDDGPSARQAQAGQLSNELGHDAIARHERARIVEQPRQPGNASMASAAPGTPGVHVERRAVDSNPDRRRAVGRPHCAHDRSGQDAHLWIARTLAEDRHRFHRSDAVRDLEGPSQRSLWLDWLLTHGLHGHPQV